MNPSVDNQSRVKKSVSKVLIMLGLAIIALSAFPAMTASAMGLDSPLVGGVTMMYAMIIAAFLLVVGVILWSIKAPGVSKAGMVMTVICLPILLVLVIVLAASPAQVAPPSEVTPVFKVLSVGGTTTTGSAASNYTASSHTFTVSMRVNTTADTITGPKYWAANFTVQRTDAGSAIDVAMMSASMTQQQTTDAVTGLTYNTIKPAADGRPSLNWTLTGSITATYTLSSQTGLTPFATGWFALNVTWNPTAFSTSNVVVNSIIPAGTIVVGPETYNIQVLVAGVNT